MGKGLGLLILWVLGGGGGGGRGGLLRTGGYDSDSYRRINWFKNRQTVMYYKDSV